MSRKRRRKEHSCNQARRDDYQKNLHRRRVRASQRALGLLQKWAADIESAIAQAKATLRRVLTLVVLPRENEEGVVDIFFGELSDDRHGHAVIAGGRVVYGRAWGKKRPPWRQRKYQRLLSAA